MVYRSEPESREVPQRPLLLLLQLASLVSFAGLRLETTWCFEEARRQRAANSSRPQIRARIFRAGPGRRASPTFVLRNVRSRWRALLWVAQDSSLPPRALQALRTDQNGLLRRAPERFVETRHDCDSSRRSWHPLWFFRRLSAERASRTAAPRASPSRPSTSVLAFQLRDERAADLRGLSGDSTVQDSSIRRRIHRNGRRRDSVASMSCA